MVNGSGESWVDTVARVVRAVQGTDVTELTLEHEPFFLHLERAPSVATAPEPGPAPEEGEPAVIPGHHTVTAPLTGIFYRAPSPTARPYVEEGDWVDTAAVVGLIETMKIFNEITADHAGRIVRFHGQPGQLVHVGDPLVTIALAERRPAEQKDT